MFLDPTKWKKASDQPVQRIDLPGWSNLPEWRGHFLHRPISAAELVDVHKIATSETGDHDRVAFGCELIARALVNEDGSRMYSPTLGHSIKDWPAVVWGLVFDEVSIANGLKDVAAKNSNAGGSGSSSDSPSEPAAKP